jgi:hypothetical protein
MGSRNIWDGKYGMAAVISWRNRLETGEDVLKETSLFCLGQPISTATAKGLVQRTFYL